MRSYQHSKLVKTLVFGNITIYMSFIVMLIIGISHENNGGTFISENIILSVLYVLLILWLFYVSYGLLTYEKWSRLTAIYSNISVAFLLVGLKAIVFIMFVDNVDSINYNQYFDLGTSVSLALGVLLVVISIFYMKKTISQEFT